MQAASFRSEGARTEPESALLEAAQKRIQAAQLQEDMAVQAGKTGSSRDLRKSVTKQEGGQLPTQETGWDAIDLSESAAEAARMLAADGKSRLPTIPEEEEETATQHNDPGTLRLHPGWLSGLWGQGRQQPPKEMERSKIPTPAQRPNFKKRKRAQAQNLTIERPLTLPAAASVPTNVGAAKDLRAASGQVVQPGGQQLIQSLRLDPELVRTMEELRDNNLSVQFQNSGGGRDTVNPLWKFEIPAADAPLGRVPQRPLLAITHEGGSDGVGVLGGATDGATAADNKAEDREVKAQRSVGPPTPAAQTSKWKQTSTQEGRARKKQRKQQKRKLKF